jgi:large subunit ribosomal protein L15
MSTIGNLRPAIGAIKKVKRVGRGQGSGHGKTSTRGSNGAGSRSGAKFKIGFEGGQMPLSRRLPKFGFKSPFRVEYAEVNLERIEDCLKSGKLTGSEPITPALLRATGIVSKGHVPVKILGNGEITKAVTIKVHKVTKGAQAKIEAAGGTVEGLA